MKNNLFFGFIIFTFLANAQTTKVEKGQLKLNFLAPGIEYEIGLMDKTSLSFEVGSGFLYRYSSNFGSDFLLSPYFETQ